MKERVDLNNNGLSIESNAYVLQNNKWVQRHILCKKPTDLNVPILVVFKNKREKQHNVYKFSKAIQNYVGFESGFEFKRKTNTLSIITEEVLVTLAFQRPENLVIWETWLKNTCGHTISFFMQLKRLPTACHNSEALMKEVRCHVHDGLLAVVYGKPQQVIFFAEIDDCQIEVNEKHDLITICPDMNTPKEIFIFVCAQSQLFRMCIEATKSEGSVRNLWKTQQYEGAWLPNTRKSEAHHSSQLTVQLSELASLLKTPEPLINRTIQSNRLNKQKSKSGYVFSNSKNVHMPVSRANSTAAYYANFNDSNTNKPGPSVEDVSNNYVNIDQSSSNKPDDFSSPYVSNYYNCIEDSLERHEHSIIPPVVQASRSTSLPEYVNIQLNAQQPSSSPKKSKEHTSNIAEKIRRRSDNTVSQLSMHPSTSKGRSLSNFSTAPYETEVRHENWRRAKKFFSAFKPKSQSDLLQKRSQNRQNLKKSSSTGALQFSSSISYFPCQSSDSMSETEDLPPSLNMAISKQTGASQTPLNENPPTGLVRPREEIGIRARSSVSGILARRLAASIRGSFSKYDGEKLTHMYQPTPPPPPLVDPDQPPPRPPKSEKFDGITSAVNRGQEKLKMSDRRASNVSFHKVHAAIGLPFQPERMDTPPMEPQNYAMSRILPHPTSEHNSNSYSDCTRSSTESLSSDARSRISIRKRNNSPPRTIAPSLNTVTRITLNAGSSMESLNSDRTTRTVSPLPLPKRKSQNSTSTQSIQSQLSHRTITTVNVNYCDLALRAVPSSSSSNSVCSRVEYMVIDPVTTKAAQEASSSIQNNSFEASRVKSASMLGMSTGRRQSQGQGSTTSDSLSVGQPSRQGFFCKYRKMRRKKKNATSLSQLNI